MDLAKHPPREAYIEGFLTGQLVAYCEQIRLGSRLAGTINCDRAYVEKLLPIAAQEGCRTEVMAIDNDRVCLWIYKYEFLRRVIGAVESKHAESDLGMWAMGKLFGYADSDIAKYINEHSSEETT